jgi:hypothetical protein
MNRVKHISELIEISKQKQNKTKSLVDHFVTYVEDVIVFELKKRTDKTCSISICSKEHPASFLEREQNIDVKTVEKIFDEIFEKMELGDTEMYEFAVFTCFDGTIGWSFLFDVQEP